MSTVDPDLRWWRRAPLLRRATTVAWAIVLLLAIVTGWANAHYFSGAVWQSWAGAEYLSGVEGVPEPIVRLAELSILVLPWPVIAAFALDVYAGVVADDGPAWALPRGAGFTSLGLGLGATAAMALGTARGAADFVIPVLLLLGGIAALAIKPIAGRVSESRRQRRERSRLSGAKTTAVATKLDIVTYNDVDFYRVTLKFTDATGQDRWFRTRTPPIHELYSAPWYPQLGMRYRLYYDPKRPGRRSSISVDLRHPL